MAQDTPNTALLPNPSNQDSKAELYTITVEAPEAGGIQAYLVAPGAQIDFGNINLAEAAMREENGNLRITLADGSELLLLDYVGASQSTQPPVLLSASGTLTAAQVMATVLAADAFISATPAAGAEYCEPGEVHEPVAVVEPKPAPVKKAAPAVVEVAELEKVFEVEPAAGPEPVTISSNGFQTAAAAAALGINDTIISSVIDPFGTTDRLDAIPEELPVQDGTPATPVAVNTVTAVNDVASIHCGTATIVDVLANDSDAQNDTFNISRIVSAPADVNVIINANGTVTATPTAHFVGTRTVVYEITDANGATDTATVTLNYTNNAPVAVNDSTTTPGNTPVTVTVLGNDTDPDGDSISVTRIVTNGTNGTAVLNANGTITYTPNATFGGTDTVTYEITDSCGATSTATVTINVANQGPDAVNDAATIHCGTATTISVLANDTDPNGDTLSVTRIVTSPADVNVVLNANGTVTATPTAHFVGTRTFTYEITDGNGGTDIATVTLNYTNNAPVAVNDSTTTPGNTPVTVTVLGNDTDPDGDSISVTRIVTNGTNGTAVLNANGTITYTPNATFGGTDTVTYEITDSCGATSTATVTINVANQGPDAVDDAASIHCGNAITINVLTNDTDPNGNTLNVTRIVTSPADVNVVLNSNGTITATPTAHFIGTRTFTYEITDGNGGTDIATVTLTYTNNAPVAVNDTTATANAVPVTVNVIGNDSDPDGDSISVTRIVSNGANGTAVLNTDGTITYTPTGTFSGSDTITYEITDSCGATDTATVTINVGPVNVPPNAVNDAATIHCGNAATINVLANDSDSDGGTVSVTRILTSPSNVNVVLNANGTITATPTSHFVGTRTFTYEITDGQGGTDTATVTLNYTNNAPVARNDSYSLNVGGTITFNVLSNDTDADGDAITLVTNTGIGGGNLTYLGNGTYRYTSTSAGTNSFSYTIRDACGATDTATVTIQANAVVTNTGGSDSGGGGGDDCPFVIDLDGDGIQIASRATSGANFDLNGDGIAEATAWVTGNDAILAVDRNGDGMINGIDEVFGNSVQDGYQELAEREDTNGDGVIDANDAGFENLRLWIDANGNGVSEEGELVALDEYGIVSIDTNATDTDVQFEDAYINRESTVTLEDGSTLDTASVWYTNTSERVEVLDLTQDDDNSVSLSATDVLNFNAQGGLTVLGEEGDEINITDTALTQTGTTEVDGTTFATFSTDNGADLMVELGVMLNGEVVQ